MRRLLLVVLFLISWQWMFAQTDYAGSGRAILFDGIDDYIDLGDIYDDFTLPVTISAWVYVEPNSSIIQYPIFSSQDNSPVYHGFTFVCSTVPHIGFTIGDGRGGNNPAFRRSRAGYFNTLGRWVHLAAVGRSGTDLHTYLNGREVSVEYQGSSTHPMNSNAPGQTAKIGYLFSNGFLYHFKGIMDEVRIWNRALSESEIRETMCRRLSGNEPGLVGYWNFDEESGSEVKDLSVNKFHGVLKGNPTRVFSGAPIGDESVSLYTNAWTGKTLTTEGFTIKNISGNPFGAHVYSVNRTPSQAAGLDPAKVALPYYGVYLADDEIANTFDFEFSEKNCPPFQRVDNSVALWDASVTFSGIETRTEVIRGFGEELKLELGDDVELCDEASYLIEPDIKRANAAYLWSTGETSAEALVTSTGMYTLKVTDGCQATSDSVRVSFGSVPPSFTLGEDEQECSMDPRILSVLDVDSIEFQFAWQDGSTARSVLATEFGTYWLKLENACGTSIDSIVFTKKEFTELYYYNFMSPDTGGDEKNTYFQVDDKLVGCRLSMFNRWGKQVYWSDDYQNDWSGDGLPAGVYYYILDHECIEPRKGTVTIMR